MFPRVKRKEDQVDMLNNISFIIPIYNDNSHLVETLRHLQIAIESSQITNYEVIVVDDGSDEPVSQIEGLPKSGLCVLRFENQGRLNARLNGLNESKFDQVVLLDSRVSIAEDSLKNLSSCLSRIDQVPAMVIAKITFPPEANLVGLFWDAIARIVWFRYYLDEIDTYLTEENFDSLPKGTTLLYSEKAVLLRAYDLLSESQLNNRDTNDDTLLIKRIVSTNKVLLSKGFLATYYPRTNLKSFIKHAHHRGMVAKGGYFASGSEGIRLVRIASAVLAFLLTLGIYSTTISITIVVLGLGLLEIVFATRIRSKHLLSLNLLVLPFLFSYGLGVIRSLLSR